MGTTSQKKKGQYYGTVLGSVVAQGERLSIARPSLLGSSQVGKSQRQKAAAQGGGVKGASHQQPLSARPPAQCSSMVRFQPGALLLAVRHDSVESSGCINANRTVLA